MEKLETTGYSGVTRWHKNVSHYVSINCVSIILVKTEPQVNMLQQDLLLAFINHGRCHWTLLVYM